ncbi:hypothetical protein ACN6KF_003041 [Labrys sp. La1]|uniref:hypothetical protein n=1 Tax=Labrys sp. La1 TaxID=3404917 RepID=UPI003EC12DBD
MTKNHTVVTILFSNGQKLEAYFEADGLTFEEEAKQAVISIDSMKLQLDPAKIGDREVAMRAEFAKAFPSTT